MARGLNHVLLVGALTQAPELRYTPGGLAILELNLAGNDHVTGEDGQLRELAWYHRAKLFGTPAENMVNNLTAGSPVFVEGRLGYRSWEGPDGQRRSSLDINALRVEPLGFGPRKGEATVEDVKGQSRLRDALNQVTIIGNLTRDAELRYTPSGHAVTRFTVAVNESYQVKGEWQEKTHYVDVNVWRELAEACGELAKGDPVLVIGRLVNDSWTDKEGNRRFTTRIEASRVEFLTRGPGGGGAGARPESEGARVGQEDKRRLDIDEEFPPEEDLPF
jgi:single-strand DNA-binding protein